MPAHMRTHRLCQCGGSNSRNRGEAALRYNYQFLTDKELKAAILGPQQSNRVIKHSPDCAVEGIAPRQPFLHGGKQNRNLPQ